MKLHRRGEHDCDEQLLVAIGDELAAIREDGGERGGVLRVRADGEAVEERRARDRDGDEDVFGIRRGGGVRG